MTRGYHRDAFVIEDLEGPRFELALERLLSGHRFEFRDVAFALARDGALVCVVDSSWGTARITPATAAKDLEGGRAVLEHLVHSSPRFAAAIRGRPVRYELIEDYGNGSILVGSKIDDVFTWAPGFPTEAG